jgi:type II secretory ATPase GspE/PulE/Tfp pilus assembly ATPase PilB-like protein
MLNIPIQNIAAAARRVARTSDFPLPARAVPSYVDGGEVSQARAYVDLAATGHPVFTSIASASAFAVLERLEHLMHETGAITLSGPTLSGKSRTDWSSLMKQVRR